MASSDTVTKRRQTAGRQVRGWRATSAAGRTVHWSARLIGLFVVMLLVVAIGVSVRSPEPVAPVYSASEQAQLNAEQRYRTLADVVRATTAGGAAATAAAVAATDPTRTALLTAIAADLDAQADAVALPRPPVPAGGTTTDGATASGGPSDPAAAATPGKRGADPARVLTMLRESALRSLRDAVEAEPGPARVLAAAGANQWRHTVLLAEALGAESGLPPSDALPVGDLTAGAGLFAEDAEPHGPQEPPVGGTTDDGGSPLPAEDAGDDDSAADTPENAAAPGTGDPAPSECAGAPLGSEADRQALLTAKKAEDQARYGYEVAGALLPDPAGALALSAIHREAADVAADLLAGLCDPAAPAPVGIAISPAFRADPATATRELEQDHAELYAGLVSAAMSDVARAWAVVSFSAAAQRSLDAGTPLETFPRLDADLAGAADGPSSPAVIRVPDNPTPTEAAPTEATPTEAEPTEAEPTEPTDGL